MTEMALHSSWVVLHCLYAAAVPVPKTPICSQKLTNDDIAEFSYAVIKHYWYELFMDDLPMWGFVGEVKQKQAGQQLPDVLLYSHKQLDISYNGDRVSPAAKLCPLNSSSNNRPLIKTQSQLLEPSDTSTWHGDLSVLSVHLPTGIGHLYHLSDLAPVRWRWKVAQS